MKIIITESQMTFLKQKEFVKNYIKNYCKEKNIPFVDYDMEVDILDAFRAPMYGGVEEGTPILNFIFITKDFIDPEVVDELLNEIEFVMSMVFSTTEDDKPSALWNYQILYM
jgi:hypothetical protein